MALTPEDNKRIAAALGLDTARSIYNNPDMTYGISRFDTWEGFRLIMETDTPKKRKWWDEFLWWCNDVKHIVWIYADRDANITDFAIKHNYIGHALGFALNEWLKGRKG